MSYRIKKKLEHRLGLLVTYIALGNGNGNDQIIIGYILFFIRGDFLYFTIHENLDVQ